MLAVAALIGMLAAPAAQAQNWSLSPTYGSISLSSGFSNDPRYLTVTAGGSRHFSGGGCSGWVADAPDFRVHYNAGSVFSLSFYVRAPGDTILVVNDPSGRWYCNDDTAGLDPGMTFPNPSSGQYDIWVGTFNRNMINGARLYVSELGVFN
ncbi:peptidase S1 [Rhodobacteraceae bacterium WD3A24]|nr:peptidase S1 [Rhodobacteraceae bacterium WD3A24]